MTIMTMIWPNKDQKTHEVEQKLDMTPSRMALVFGILVVMITIAFYIIFWDHATPMFPTQIVLNK